MVQVAFATRKMDSGQSAGGLRALEKRITISPCGEIEVAVDLPSLRMTNRTKTKLTSLGSPEYLDFGTRF